MWETYQEVIADVDADIAAHLKTMKPKSELPPCLPENGCVDASRTIRVSMCGRRCTWRVEWT
jgi:hypothetical protein